MGENTNSVKKSIFRRGYFVTLGPVMEADYEKLAIWLNDPAINSSRTQYYPVTDAREHSLCGGGPYKYCKNVIFAVDDIETGLCIGIAGLYDIDRENRFATYRIHIGDKKFLGAGHAIDVKMLVVHYAFYTLDLRKLCSSVLKGNERALRYALRTGSVQEGIRKRQLFKDGKYQDEVLLAIFREDEEGRDIWHNHWEDYQVRITSLLLHRKNDIAGV